jgi:hypothetical protein
MTSMDNEAVQACSSSLPRPFTICGLMVLAVWAVPGWRRCWLVPFRLASMNLNELRVQAEQDFTCMQQRPATLTSQESA